MALMILMYFWFKIFKGGHRSEKIQAMLANRTYGQDAETVETWKLMVAAVVVIFLGTLVACWICKCTIPSAIYIAFIRCSLVYYCNVALTS